MSIIMSKDIRCLENFHTFLTDLIRIRICKVTFMKINKLKQNSIINKNSILRK